MGHVVFSGAQAPLLRRLPGSLWVTLSCSQGKGQEVETGGGRGSPETPAPAEGAVGGVVVKGACRLQVSPSQAACGLQVGQLCRSQCPCVFSFREGGNDGVEQKDQRAIVVGFANEGKKWKIRLGWGWRSSHLILPHGGSFGKIQGS